MKMTEVKEKAKSLGISPGKMKKADLIHAIQSTEGNFPCFKTGLPSCDQYNCCWRSDCLPESSTGAKGKSKRDLYLEKIRDELDEFKSKLEDFKENTKKLVGEKKRDAIEEITMLEKKAEEEIKDKIHEISAASEEAWKNVKKGIDSSRDELKDALHKAFAKFNIKRK